MNDITQLHSKVGQEVGVSPWFEIGQERIDQFASAIVDPQWIHIDPERARRESPFGRPIAHGYLSLSLAPMFLFEELDVTGARFIVNYGLNKVRFPAPVPVGARVRMAFEGLAVDPIDGGWQVTMKAALEVEGSPKPGMVAELVYRYLL